MAVIFYKKTKKKKTSYRSFKIFDLEILIIQALPLHAAQPDANIAFNPLPYHDLKVDPPIAT